MRSPDWPEKLAEYIEACRETAFAYGSHDCCQFAGKAVEAMTGTNPAAVWEYSTELGAARYILEAGSLAALVSQALGDPLASPAFAGRGDVVLATLDHGDTLGICLGRSCAFADAVGILMLPREIVSTAWRID